MQFLPLTLLPSIVHDCFDGGHSRCYVDSQSHGYWATAAAAIAGAPHLPCKGRWMEATNF